MTPPAAATIPSQTPRETFRPVHYMGNKARILGAIGTAVDAVDPQRGPVLDLFSGSGVVAAELGRSRPVVAADIQEYARVLAAALLNPARLDTAEIESVTALGLERAQALAEDAGVGGLIAHESEAINHLERGDAGPFCELIEQGSMVVFERGHSDPSAALGSILAAAPLPVAEPLTITRHYGGVFFGYAQALQLDCLLAVARSQKGLARDTCLAAVLGAASAAVNSVGSHFAQPIRPRDRAGRPKLATLAAAVRRRRRDCGEHFAALLRRYAEQPGAAFPARSLQADYRTLLDSPPRAFSVVYADPPYTRDHYSRFYHVLETIARGDDPDVSTVTAGGTTSVSRGLYRADRHQSPFCIRTQAPEAFRRLFAGVRALDASLVLSYSPYTSGTAARPQPRVLTIAALVEMAAEHFGEVEARSAGQLSHSRFNAQHLNGVIEGEAETLLVCRP